MRFGIRTLTFCGVLLQAPVVLVGQGQPVELGFDSGMNLFLNDPKASLISIPDQAIRFGVFVSNRLSIEPSIGLTWIDGQEREPFTTVSLGLSGLFHITPDRSKPQAFLRPTTGVEYNFFRANNEIQFAAGGYLGLRIPAASHLSVRLESGFLRRFESENVVSSDMVSFNFGVSLFVK